MKLKAIIAIGVGTLLLAVGLLAGRSLNRGDISFGVATAEIINEGSDVVGTHVGTSTTGVALTVTTSSVFKYIGSNVDTAIFGVKITAASTTNNFNAMVYGSNDYSCETTVTSTSGEVWTTDINWFSAMDHLRNKVHATSITNTSTVFLAGVNLQQGTGMPIILTDLRYRCLRFDYAGVSTTAYVNLVTK